MRDLRLERTPAEGRPPLPSARGPLSAELLELLAGGRAATHRAPTPLDPLGDDDLHLALYLAYELHYRGLPGVPDDAEWEPAILGARRALEATFEA